MSSDYSVRVQCSLGEQSSKRARSYLGAFGRDAADWRPQRIETPMELVPNVHAVTLRGCTGYLITEKRLTLIDAGLPGSRRPLERYLRTIDRRFEELERIVCTHGHPDHAGGVRELASGGAEVLIHPDDLSGLELTLREVLRARRRGPLLHFLTPHPGETTPLQDGDILPVLGGLTVIHTPGHTPGSVCLWTPEHRILFTGDVLQVRRGRLTYASSIFSHDYPAARSSIARLADLDVDTIALAHFPPWRREPQATLRRLAQRAVS
jgi:glyoxylase-like metal-dependent hydrolase (beta-lactamase superfamily II)